MPSTRAVTAKWQERTVAAKRWRLPCAVTEDELATGYRWTVDRVRGKDGNSRLPRMGGVRGGSALSTSEKEGQKEGRTDE